MSDERTIEPSPRRLREARERGVVASSPGLTAAVGLLAAAAALGACGEALVDGIVGLLPGLDAAEGLLDADRDAFLDRVRDAGLAVATPLLAVLGATAVASVGAHQLQVGGLFVPSLALPDPGRLRPFAKAVAVGDRLARASGSALRFAGVLALAWWTIAGWLREGHAMGTPGTGATAVGAMAKALHGLLIRLGLALLAFGLIDYAAQVRRVSARLRMSPEEQREELRAQGGRRRPAARRHHDHSVEHSPGTASPSLDAADRVASVG